jgi:hypothetical protein
MKLGSKDFRKLQISVFGMLLMVALGVASVLFSRSQVKQADQAFSATQSERNNQDTKLKRLRSEERQIREHAALFNALKARGVIGEEQRLEWVELLKEIRERHRLIELRYEISPQQPLEKTPVGTLALHASTMKLQLNLLHEEDLIRLLDDLRRQAHALLQVKRCDVSRMQRSGPENTLQGYLQAECLIEWVTVRETEKVAGK